ncbi:DUF3602 domain-containing protein ASCRUDRAFT_6897 [Ascoidea rubescens DSM 1968]|uniref:Uncharacterized protein n=1 Tax=Ascoidea rubescens DSM 1968 TaxID=1344418 RepID=A0A1D2VL16_9ASCO|nr:hypothetical protein ASCRUDRAFT_6897 [Ascoidea rubescens DSM 1968]ODV62295.1 hypothetical protein ASCRUDRAFT_6897 [Ascoidea rubescens DSM 1968]
MSGNQVYISVGRGGAGNMVKDKSPVSPKLIPMGSDTPHIPATQPRYTTGRGGAGNMVKNDDPDKARLAQDIEPIRSNGSYTYKPLSPYKSIGRGGFGNMIDTTVSKTSSVSRCVSRESKSSSKSHDGSILKKLKNFF